MANARRPGAMAMMRRFYHALLRHLWPPVEPALLTAGRDGDVIAARTRIAMASLLSFSPLVTLYQNPDAGQATLALVLALVFVAAGAWTYWLTRQEPYPAWAGYAGTMADVTLISAYQVMLFVNDLSFVAFNSRVTFTLYVFVIIGTGLRYDPRLALSAGLLAAAQWMGIIVWANGTGLAPEAIASGRFYPTTRVDGQFEELIVLAAATVMALIIVGRSREIRLSSVLDGLTRLLNKAHFEERFALELERAMRHGRPLALAILDLDRFKAINDTMGHPAGDAVICEAADRLRKKVRRTDLVARLGGDEFAVVLPETPPAEAVAKVEKLCAAIGGSPIDVEQVAVTVTCSAGVCFCPSDGAAVSVLVAAADKRLLDAKRRGRNRVVADSALSLAPPHPSLAR
jgi:diguanylate cyclase (GGDEF)-like protein